ncbi:hypothetical protein [Zeimonas arvi]|uniref:FecR protein domain-containing protein n=1 Tax=Zeimonas arvi TaxID=2498847 RepID=A0A5C8NWD3_9BURK|nr:hypothetical protein [Zeimonas arvi]TXL65300.1 hypothetical protein FHP08_10915 [Zeimonas arvi]
MIRMGAGAALSVLSFDDRIGPFRLTQGILNVRVLRVDRGQMFEVDTPNLAFTIRQPGDYRIEVDPRGDSTTIFVRQGQGEVYGEGTAAVRVPQQRVSGGPVAATAPVAPTRRSVSGAAVRRRQPPAQRALEPDRPRGRKAQA